ncbi:MAG: DUF4870 domain-containing protein, partial [Planctomycetia bacterium]|jgi:uncharacterized Tic20 family protein|nr:DUF4870 domain-containing protein [Planctomycetia bacterium]
MTTDSSNPQPTGAPPQYVPTPEERSWGLLAHLSSLIASLLGGLSFLGPLIIWLVKKDESPFVGDQAKEALNFQIAVMIASLVCTITCVGIIIVPVLLVGDIVFTVIGAMEANKGVYYRYPYTLRLIS